MTIHDSVVYAADYSAFLRTSIVRFDPQIRTFLSNALALGKEPEDIKAHKSRLHFIDYRKSNVGVMPISDLRSIN